MPFFYYTGALIIRPIIYYHSLVCCYIYLNRVESAMESAEIKALLEEHFSPSTIDVVVEGSHVNVQIISSVFDGLNTLKRQQSVYAVLSEHIASGVIHAVNMKTLTPEEAPNQP